MTDSELMLRNFAEQVQAWPEKARGLKISDQTGYAAAGEMLLAIRELRKEIAANYDPVIARSHETHMAAIAAKKKVETPLAQAEALLKESILAYTRQQEARSRQLEEAARRESARISEEIRLQAAIQAEREGAQAPEIEAILESRVDVPAPRIAPTIQRVAGISTRTNWKWSCYDDQIVPRQYLTLNERAINAIVRAQGAACDIPGIEVYEDSQIVPTGKR